MSKIFKFSIFIFCTITILCYQNCTELNTDSISQLSEGISGVKSINGDIYVLDSNDLSDYLAEEKNYSNYSGTIPTTEDQILDVTAITSSSSTSSFLCMFTSESNPTIYFPLAIDDYDSSVSIDSEILVPICMPKIACDNYVSELGKVIALESDLCKQNSLAKKYNSGQVLQLIKRY